MASKDRNVELEVMRMVQELEHEKKSAKDAHNLLAGNWRLVFSTSEQLSTLSSIMGGPLKVYYESIGDDTIHIATPFKGFFLLLVAPLLIVTGLVLALPARLSFVTSLVLTVIIFYLAAKFGPSGLYASRRNALKVSEDLVVSSRLDRDVLAVFAAHFGFDKSSPDPMATFCRKFDDANGSKDILRVGPLLGWRLVLNPFALHFLAHQTTRKEKILYIDEQIRVMLGGDVDKDGNVNNALNIFVRA